jgi:hypothetical protein
MGAFEELVHVIPRQTHTRIMFLKRGDGLKTRLRLDASFTVVLTESHEFDIGCSFIILFQIMVKGFKGLQWDTRLTNRDKLDIGWVFHGFSK